MSLWQRILSESPCVAAFDSGLGAEDLRQLLSTRGYQASQGYDFASGSSFDTEYRTSSTLFDHTDRFRAIRQHLIQRIKEVTGEEYTLPVTEVLQLTCYEPGQQYRPHWDNFNLPRVAPIANDRVATCILYLNDDFEGGKTELNALGLSVKPMSGYCLFFSYHTAEQVEKCLHSGTPVVNGTKKIANLWFRQHPL
jgi:prolyl 4-hydroxylase